MKKVIQFGLFVLLFLVLNPSAMSQIVDTTKYPFPMSPMTQQVNIGGTFGEYRSTSAAGHYHNGVDLSGAGGTPVLAVLPGIVRVAYHDGSTGYDSYVRVEATVNGLQKHITYYHTIPTVTVGQTVALGQQIATIAIDHVHLIEYTLGSGVSSTHLNAIRPDGGLTPYYDTWKPFIRSVKFRVDNSTTLLPSHQLSGRVDITAHIEEGNGTSSASLNNGPYEVGYKILSADGSTVVHNPADNGLRYRYYNIPGNSFANVNYYQPESNSSTHVYIVTNGTGASSVAASQAVTNDFWNTAALPHGSYKVMIFAKDTRNNADTVYVNVTTTFQDIIPPAQPKLRSVLKDSTNYFTLAWNEPTDLDLKGYRLFFSLNGATYQLRDNETVLTKGITKKQYYYNQSQPLYFKLFAVDTVFNANVSVQSDVYGVRMSNDAHKILIVDGFNRVGSGGSWSQPYHEFIVRHAEAFNLSFESCHNDEIINGTINLNNYQLVIWMLGDESTDHETFSSIEQTKVANYLESGGKLFVSGSEIAWDLEGEITSTPSDVSFLRNYLKAKYVADNSNLYSVKGIPSSFFENINFTYGQTSTGSPYIEDYPDVIDTAFGSQRSLSYGNTSSVAAINYSGKFGVSQIPGSLFYLALPFETIGSKADRTALMDKALQYFGFLPVGVMSDENLISFDYDLQQNYPNPFNPVTVISWQLPVAGHVSLKIYDMLGKEVITLVNEHKNAGRYSIDFNAGNLASGVYVYELRSGTYRAAKKLVLMK